MIMPVPGSDNGISASSTGMQRTYSLLQQVAQQVLPYEITRRIRIWKRNCLIAQFRADNLKRAYRDIRNTVDHDRIARLWRDVRPAFESGRAKEAKWADMPVWLPLSIYRAAALDLHRTPPIRILDLGCGPAYFIRVATHFGHDCQGVDLPAHLQTPVEQRVFAELVQALGCRPFVSDLVIRKFEPMPLIGQYDLITGFWVCFNRHRQSDEWRALEWRYFAADVAHLLRPRGRVYMELNANKQLFGNLLWYDAETLHFFRSVGTVDRNRVTLCRDALEALQPAHERGHAAQL